jgi:predicted metal-dependent hydrolase
MTHTGSVRYGSTAIDFQVAFAKRRTLEIAVLPTGEVEVTAPMDAAMERIRGKVKLRARWILRQKNFFGRFHPRAAPRQYLSGETHLYLGRRYRLKVESGEPSGVRLSRGVLTVRELAPPSRGRVEELVGQWYREKANDLFHRLFEEQWARGGQGASKPKLQVKSMRTRWGSLSKGGILTLNPDLIRAPKECIEYVVCHELCHLRHHDHGEGFYKLLAKRMPDWAQRKERLEDTMV